MVGDGERVELVVRDLFERLRRHSCIRGFATCRYYHCVAFSMALCRQHLHRHMLHFTLRLHTPLSRADDALQCVICVPRLGCIKNTPLVPRGDRRSELQASIN